MRGMNDVGCVECCGCFAGAKMETEKGGTDQAAWRGVMARGCLGRRKRWLALKTASAWVRERARSFDTCNARHKRTPYVIARLDGSFAVRNKSHCRFRPFRRPSRRPLSHVFLQFGQQQ
jgi:hypothetical protein